MIGQVASLGCVLAQDMQDLSGCKGWRWSAGMLSGGRGGELGEDIPFYRSLEVGSGGSID